MKKRNNKTENIYKTKRWQTAEFRYTDIYTSTMFPLFEKPTPKMIEKEMKEIITVCPEFYPALIHLGLSLVRKGKNSSGEKRLDEGYYYISKYFETKEQFETTLENLISDLEKIFRFDLAAKYLKKAILLFPKKTLFYDYLATNICETGNFNEAIEIQKKTIDLEPHNPFFLSNIAWIFLNQGDYNTAKKYLEKALKYDTKNKTNTNGNLIIVNYLEKNNGTFFDYLVRPIDYKKIDYYNETEDVEELEKLCAMYNFDRLEAFRIYLTQKTKRKPHLIFDEYETLNIFINFVEKIFYQADFLFEKISEIEMYFKPIMHKFIFKFGDIDDDLLNDVYKVIKDYSIFLKKYKLVTKTDYDSFIHTIESLKDELFDKMHRYNEIRHDVNMSEEEKEDIREELFDNDHYFPEL